MRISKIDVLICDDGWKGTCTRVLGIVLVYLGFVYLPVVVAWASAILNIVGMSEAQLRKHGAILYVIKIVVVLVIAIEVIRMLLIAVKTRC
ncbi:MULTISPECIES: hypothetical protein [Burkholderiaceae]|uniref:hypothetical protein n=1 Tax=Burkholderiaceae TaxID=119060 RepID=UPI0009679AC3|nr:MULTISPECIES: hypothetical protein [Burkholderiaceae]MCG1038415.1 hypothetical protein [Mycetohabitans sp. B7]SIT67321.1 hypothetical protein SAMN04487769_1065 [Burkholderia sp. b14]